MSASHSPTPAQRSPSRRRRRVFWAALWAVLAAAGWFCFWRHHLKRFDIVEPGVLYRVAQPSEFGLRHVLERYRIKTVLSVRLEDPPLCAGLVDFGTPDGDLESHYVPEIGLRHLQWPLGEEIYWPWLTPWTLEEFYKLFDDPANFPVLVHCVGGRHRTGTLVALFEMEYQRRTVEEVLREMYSYDFGPPAALQEFNLRSYRPRPLPDNAQWTALLSGLYPNVNREMLPADYAELVRRLKALPPEHEVIQRLQNYIEQGRPFALQLAERLIDRPDHPLVAVATQLAAQRLKASEREDDDAAALPSAAGLIADFGTTQQQRQLLELLEAEQKDEAPSARYTALAAGVASRYTSNRIAYLATLLRDRRPLPDCSASDFRYCDLATARLVSITNEPLHVGWATKQAWDDAVPACQRWLAEHPERCRLTGLTPPTGKNSVHTGLHGEIDGRNPVR